MGKNSDINTLGRIIGNMVLHNLLIKHTNKPESKNHLQKEEINYREGVIRSARKHNWNEEDKVNIKIGAAKYIENKHTTKYSDVFFSMDEAEKLIDEMIEELL